MRNPVDVAPEDPEAGARVDTANSNALPGIGSGYSSSVTSATSSRCVQAPELGWGTHAVGLAREASAASLCEWLISTPPRWPDEMPEFSLPILAWSNSAEP